MALDDAPAQVTAAPKQPPAANGPRPILARFRSGAANAALVLASLALGYLICEVVLFRVLLPTWPPAVRTYLPETADVLVQNSKSGAVPHDYIAILGDSYAEGIGDWLIEAGDDRSKPFHSANIIHEIMGRDVVSFGREGIGSAEALVRMPTHILEGSKCYQFPRLEEPSRLVVYFYAGNDIHDNLQFLRKVAAKYGGSDERRVAEYLTGEYGQFASWRCHLHLADTIGRMAKLYYHAHTRDAQAKLLASKQLSGLNRLIVGNEEIPLEHLYGPAVDMADDEIEAGASVFDQSLDWLRQRFPHVATDVVYIPAPLSVYRLAGDTAFYISQPAPGDPPIRKGEVPVAKVAHNSQMLCGLIRNASLRHGVGFLDTRPALRQAAATRPVHGPHDWSHFNEAGYRLLGRIVADELQNPSQGGCGP